MFVRSAPAPLTTFLVGIAVGLGGLPTNGSAIRPLENRQIAHQSTGRSPMTPQAVPERDERSVAEPLAELIGPGLLACVGCSLT